MSKKWLAVGTIVCVLAFHVPAILFDWYFYFWWYDVLMHVLGGVAMGFLGSWLFTVLRSESLTPSFRDLGVSFVFVLGFVALVGIGWEWFEGLADTFLVPRVNLPDTQLGLADTMFDLYFDLLGGTVAWLFLRAYTEFRR